MARQAQLVQRYAREIVEKRAEAVGRHAIGGCDLDTGGLDAAFSGFTNVDHGMAHDAETVFFLDLAVAQDGTFARGKSGTRVQGGFYGPRHVKAASIFEQPDIVGAFGAKRQ